MARRASGGLLVRAEACFRQGVLRGRSSDLRAVPVRSFAAIGAIPPHLPGKTPLYVDVVGRSRQYGGRRGWNGLVATRSASSAAGEPRNLTLSGAGKVDKGGVYNDVVLSGAVTVDGDVECRSFTQSGQGKVAGSISAKGVVRANGSLKCAGDVRASAMRVEGSADVRSVVADEVSVAGSLRVQRDVTCDKFTAKGGVSINGKLSADTVTVAAPSVGSGIAKCIAARRSVSISAQQAEWFVSMFIAQTRDPTHVGIISGDGTAAGPPVELVVLDHADAEVVRARTVQVKGRCKIDRIEYSDSAEIDPKAKVGQLVQVAFDVAGGATPWKKSET